MASRLIVPFDNNPSSTTIKTSSYTIPAGKYAEAYCYFSSHPVSVGTGSANIAFPTPYTTTINGVGYASSGGSSSNYSLNATARSITSIPLNRLATFYWNIASPSTEGSWITINGVLWQYNNAAGGNLTGYGDFVTATNQASCTGSAGARAIINIFIKPYNENIPRWYPAGTVLSGTTSFNWVVTEYNAIS